MSRITEPSGTNKGWAVPSRSCDCHTHVFLPAHRFDQARTYTPPAATIEQLGQHLRALGLERVVLVQASVYGFDNGAALEAVAALGPDRARGVAVVPEDVAHDELVRLSAGGMQGARLAFASAAGAVDLRRAENQIRSLAERLEAVGWHLQIYAFLPLIRQLLPVFHDLPVPVVFDHFAGARAEGGLDQPGLPEVLELVRAGRAYVKLSSSYRISGQPSPFPDVTPLARAFVDANPARMLWGSDWPHPDAHGAHDALAISPALPVDDAGVFAQLAEWAGSADTYRAILRDNPARLYGFPPG